MEMGSRNCDWDWYR